MARRVGVEEGKPQDKFIKDGVFIVYTNLWTDDQGNDAHLATSSCSAAFDAAFGSKLYAINYCVIGCTRIDAGTCAR